ncbi:MAG: nucleotide exchange factor GrpE [Methylocapsa sp.]|nr:nucleotide exchange factor GrpE [Methylocapsa sp.]
MNDAKRAEYKAQNGESGAIPESREGVAGPAAGSAEAPLSSGEAEAGEPAAELDKLRGETAELKDKLLRALAETENLRRRSERETADARAYGVASFARDMVAVADNLRRALASIPQELREKAEYSWKAFAEGIEVTERDFLSRLAKYGVKKLDPLGSKFDPNLHEALFEVADDRAPNGTVVQVVEEGYAIGDRVLRPAKVGVSRCGSKAPGGNGETPA